jgi:D-alanine-D-alanine ligase
MRVVVLHNAEASLERGEARDALAVTAVQSCARAVAAGLRSRGHEVATQGAPEDPVALLESLHAAAPDAIFNLVESYRGVSALEPAVVALLELSGIPFTGNRSLASTLALRKPIAKALLQAAGVPVPPGVVVAEAAAREDGGATTLRALAASVPPPWIVKPAEEDASHGIDSASVVTDVASAAARVALVAERWRQPVVVERFIPGRELNVALLGPHAAPTVLPLRAIDFSRLPPGLPPLVTYASKWVEGSVDWNGTEVVDADLPEAAASRVREAATRAWTALALTGYGRVDLRLAGDGTPVVLEANPNPDLSPDAGFALAWGRTGSTHAELLERILHLARPGPSP